MTKVIFDIMRHGEKDGDVLTKKGEKQVRQSAKKNLPGCRYTRAFFSGYVRARQTVQACLSTLRDAGISTIEIEPGFSYEPAMQQAEQWAGRPYSALKEEGKGQNVKWWLRNWAPALWLRGQVLTTMRLQAEMLATSSRDYRVLVGGHGPAAESACLDPSTTPSLREADIIRYTWEVGQTVGTIPRLIESVVLRAPY